MSDLIGTVIKVKELYGKQEAALTVPYSVGESMDILKLGKNRRYIIPDFQREIRWKKEQVIELMLDVSVRKKFLGNIILTKNGDDYELIDGQQRTTVMMMLIQYIKYRFSDDIEILDTCELINDSFAGFSYLFERNFDFYNLQDHEQKQIMETDKYKQLGRFLQIWDVIKESEILEDSDAAEKFLNNLEDSELNVIVNVDGTSTSIEYFLDVNLKGVKLDTEDIFKGYLFSKDTSEEIREKWTVFKEKNTQFSNTNNNGLKKRGRPSEKELQKINYPLIKLIEHGLYCMMYEENSKYSNIEFDEQFLIIKEVTDGRKHHYKGEHIVKVINNKKFMNRLFDNIIEYEDFVINILSGKNYDLQFENLFSKKLKIDPDEYEVMYNFIKKILRDNLEIPKILIMKYFLTMRDYEGSNKKAHKMIYGIYVYAVLFTIFETKKGKDKIFDIIRSDDWYSELIRGINKYFKSEELTGTRLMAQVKYSLKDDNEDDRYRCKSLATIYNFMQMSENDVKIINMKEVLTYINNSEEFSIEHFLINDSGICNYGCHGNIVYEYPYEPEIKKYIKSLFNFIFIKREMNSSMKNLSLDRKLQYLNEQKESIPCEFSKMIIETADKCFELPTLAKIVEISEDSDWKEYIEGYFAVTFKKQYQKFVNEVLEKIYSKFRE